MGSICTLTCCYRNSAQTLESKVTRISFYITGAILVIAGSLNFAGVNAFSQFGSSVAAIFLSTGIIMLSVASCCKCVQLKGSQQKLQKFQQEKELDYLNPLLDINKLFAKYEPKNWVKPSREFLKYFPLWMIPTLQNSVFFIEDSDAKIRRAQTFVKEPIITFQHMNGLGEFGLKLNVQHVDLQLNQSEISQGLNDDLTEPFTLFVKVAQNEHGTWILCPDPSNEMQHPDKKFESANILLNAKYVTLNLDESERNALTQYKKQDDPNLPLEHRFSLEWLLMNLWDGDQPFYVCQFPDNDPNKTPISYWKISLQKENSTT